MSWLHILTGIAGYVALALGLYTLITTRLKERKAREEQREADWIARAARRRPR